MEFLCTICCKDKRADPGLLPAIDRYLSERIAFVHRESQRLGKPMLILSGKYGLLKPEEPIPWYDQKLEMEAVPGLVPVIAAQLAQYGVTRITFYCHPRTDPNWHPYIETLERACRACRVELTMRPVDGE
jgi:hypothetical protein